MLCVKWRLLIFSSFSYLLLKTHQTLGNVLVYFNCILTALLCKNFFDTFSVLLEKKIRLSFGRKIISCFMSNFYMWYLPVPKSGVDYASTDP